MFTYFSKGLVLFRIFSLLFLVIWLMPTILGYASRVSIFICWIAFSRSYFTTQYVIYLWMDNVYFIHVFPTIVLCGDSTIGTRWKSDIFSACCCRSYSIVSCTSQNNYENNFSVGSDDPCLNWRYCSVVDWHRVVQDDSVGMYSSKWESCLE